MARREVPRKKCERLMEMEGFTKVREGRRNKE